MVIDLNREVDEAAMSVEEFSLEDQIASVRRW